MKKAYLITTSLILYSATINIRSSFAYPSLLSGYSQIQVNSTSAGSFDFQGDGQAQFNNSVGTNNSFQVGSSTNLGVNASTSSTAEYGVTGQAQLDLAGATTLKQVIGTSGSSNSKANTATRAHDIAREVMSSWEGGASWDSGNSNYGSQSEWQAAYDREYNSAYNNTYTSMNSSESETGSTGTISGQFKTIETGAASSGGSMSDWSSAANASASDEYGADYENRSSTYISSTEGEWQAKYDAEYNRAYRSAASGAARSSENEVTVNGIGSDAMVQAASTSTFSVDISQKNANIYGSIGTANGSAGASLATSTFANQSQSSTASGFMQAFGGGNSSAITAHDKVMEQMKSWSGGFQWRDDPEYNVGYSSKEDWQDGFEQEFVRLYYELIN